MVAVDRGYHEAFAFLAFPTAESSLDPLYNALTGNLGFHTAHHKRPGVHGAPLPALHEEIRVQILDEQILETFLSGRSREFIHGPRPMLRRRVGRGRNLIRTAVGRRSARLSVLLLFATVSCAGLHRPSACTPHFPYRDGWLGGDAAYSIPVGPGESVWLFGDTFVGAPDQRNRQDSQLVHNSIAVSRCGHDGAWQIEYTWGERDGTARAFIDSGEEGRFWWLFDGFVFADQLYIGLLGVEKSEPRGRLKLPFRYTGMKLARIENYREPPGSWKIEILPLSDNRVAFPGAMVVHAEHLYLFAFLDRDAEHYPRMLGRLPLEALLANDPSGQLEYLASDETWRSGFDPEDALILMDDDASEMSVRYHDELGVWLAVYGYPELADRFLDVPPSDLIFARTAKRLEGPWSEPQSIFRMPELNDPASERDPNTFCYAAKEHPQFAREGRLLLTYVCNLFTPDGQDEWAVLSRLAEQMNLYRPRVISIPFPRLEAETESGIE